MRNGELYAEGLNLNFFNSSVFEKVNSGEAENAVIIGRNLLRFLMSNCEENWTDLISWQTFKAVILRRDHDLTKGFRLAFQEGFKHVFSQLEHSNLTPLQHNQAQLFISNCLTILPFADPTPYESMAIPQWVDNQWKLIDYKIVPIELTPTSGFEKLFLDDHDRVFAYGLEPLNDPRATPHLLFMGTTYPAGQGFFSSIQTDLEFFETAGKRLYRSGHANIMQWLLNQQHKVHVCGTSLGGALSLLLAIDRGDKLARVDALNTPGLNYTILRKSRFDHWDKLVDKPHVYIQKQGNDFISRFGLWKPEWNILHVVPDPKNKKLKGFRDHVLNYAGFLGTKYLGIDTEDDNNERRSRTFWYYTLLRSFAYLVVLVPMRYISLPIYRIIENNKLQSALLVPLLYTYLGALIPAVMLVNIPPVALMISAVVGGLFALHLCFKFVKLIPTLLGHNKVEPILCHNPELPRNPALDIYKNKMEAKFTLNEIHTYYQAKRSLLQCKEFIPQLTGSSTFFKSADVNKSKRDILILSQNPSLQDEVITCIATKAKIYDMHQTLQMVNRPGFQVEGLKEALKEKREQYLKGKVQSNLSPNVAPTSTYNSHT